MSIEEVRRRKDLLDIEKYIPLPELREPSNILQDIHIKQVNYQTASFWYQSIIRQVNKQTRKLLKCQTAWLPYFNWRLMVCHVETWRSHFFLQRYVLAGIWPPNDRNNQAHLAYDCNTVVRSWSIVIKLQFNRVILSRKWVIVLCFLWERPNMLNGD